MPHTASPSSIAPFGLSTPVILSLAFSRISTFSTGGFLEMVALGSTLPTQSMCLIAALAKRRCSFCLKQIWKLLYTNDNITITLTCWIITSGWYLRHFDAATVANRRKCFASSWSSSIAKRTMPEKYSHFHKFCGNFKQTSR